MAAYDRDRAKRRRLEDSSLCPSTPGEAADSSQYCYQNASTNIEASLDVTTKTDRADPNSESPCCQDIELICFGTLVSLSAHGVVESKDRLSCAFGSFLRLGDEGKLYHLHLDILCGTLESRDVQLLDLFRREEIEFDLLWMPEGLQKGNPQGNTAIWATIYGPRDLASDLRDTFEKLGLFLQDPIHASRDAPYFNPQRFYNDPNTRTTDFQLESSPPVPTPAFKDEQVAATDVLDGLAAEADLNETQGSQFLKTELKSHQKVGLTFMLRREAGWRLHHQDQDVWSQAVDEYGHVTYTNNVESSRQDQCPPNFRGGILADTMGLGKTLSMISLIAYDKDLGKEDRLTKLAGGILGRGTLIVLPPSLIHNWEEELAKHLSSKSFSWRRHHGRHRIIDTHDVGFYDIILTSYSTLAKEWQNHNKGQASILFSHDWHRIVLDEAHEIKGLSAAKSQASCALTAECRWAVTGTPIQNRLSDLFSLIHFLRLSPYCEKKAFDGAITNPWIRREETGLQALVKLLGYIMLRRPKTAISLPKRQDHRRFLSFSAQEKEAYDVAKDKALERLEDALSTGRSQDGYRNALEKINALRVICELGCWLPKPTLLQPPTNPLTYGRSMTPGTSEGSLTPSATTDDFEDDFEGDNTTIFGETSSDLQVAFPSVGDTLSYTSSCLTSQFTGSPMPTTQWPTKIQALIQSIQTYPISTKSVVFSYRTSILDVANLALNQAGISSVQIDGGVPSKKRNRIIKSFSNDREVRVLLLSLGCGAVGAYILEPQWNPAIEEQALARIYRLGQTQEVTTIRFIISGSIEQYVLDIQDGKQDLISLLNYKPGDQVATKLQLLRQLLS